MDTRNLQRGDEKNQRRGKEAIASEDTVGRQYSLDGFTSEYTEPDHIPPKKRKDEAKRDFVNHFLYVFKAPIVTMPQYEDLITSEMKEKTTIYRLVGAKEIDQERCTDYEAMLYLHTASLMNPFSHSWYKIYMHTFSKFYDINMILNSDEKLEKIYDNEMDDLNHLKSWIYKKQIDQIKPNLMKRNETKKPENERLF